MNYKQVIMTVFLTVMLSACNSTKNTTNEAAASENDIYGHTWELEYITGTRIAFDGLFPDQKPYLNFDKERKMVTGSGGCNGYSADFELKGTSLEFGDKGITTLMHCGDGEPQFLKMLEKVDAYKIDSDGKLNLLMNDLPIMRFNKK
ncbi:MAG: META domain-containing protein [Aquaticitalea sp.]